MKQFTSDAEKVIRDRVFEVILDAPFTFDTDSHLDFSDFAAGNLQQQNEDFWIFDTELDATYRAGPSKAAPTRYEGALRVSFHTKSPSGLSDQRKLEWVADKFSEQTLQGVRFRTFIPYSASTENGFTVLRGVISFDFELYRGYRYGS